MTKEQYLDLNVKIQKSLILDFDLHSAQESAVEDWKIDIEREAVEKDATNTEDAYFGQSKEGTDQESKDTDGVKHIQYERLSEFFFDLCLSWCQHLDIETYIFFLNGIFLNITQGSHLNVSTFKDTEDIQVLSVEFFNKLLMYRTQCEEELEAGQTYADWYSKNFGRS